MDRFRWSVLTLLATIALGAAACTDNSASVGVVSPVTRATPGATATPRPSASPSGVSGNVVPASSASPTATPTFTPPPTTPPTPPQATPVPTPVPT